MAPADCVQKSALIIQLRFLLFMSGRMRGEPGERAANGERRAASERRGPAEDSPAAAVKEQAAVFYWFYWFTA